MSSQDGKDCAERSNSNFGGWGSNYQSVGDLLRVPTTVQQPPSGSNSRRQSTVIYTVNPSTSAEHTDDPTGLSYVKRGSFDSDISENSWNRRCFILYRVDEQ